jgi:hypothetical protein
MRVGATDESEALRLVAWEQVLEWACVYYVRDPSGGSSKSVNFCGFHVLYAVRDAILFHSASSATSHRNSVTLASALQRSQLTVALTSPDNGPAAARVQYLEIYGQL